MSKLHKWSSLTFPILLLAISLGLIFSLSACNASGANSSNAPRPFWTPPAGVTLNGAGATFPFPLYSKWFDVYQQTAGVKINYQSIGSGGGIQQITAGAVDFGASDGIMTDDQITAAQAAYGPILHIPMTSGAEAIIYNLSGISSGQLKLTSDVLANIFLKKITSWSDPAIKALNPGLALPDADIVVLHRADGSGTTFIFTNYLSKVSAEWNTRVGYSTSVNWPGDVAGQGNDGVTQQVMQKPNSIGYVNMEYAVQNKLPWATVKNAAGNWVQPSQTGITQSAAGVALPDDMKVMITNSSNPDAYPICGFTWILAYTNQTDKNKGQTLVNFLWWAEHDGQKFALPLNYGPLSTDVVKKAENEILSIKFQNNALLSR